MAALCPPEQLNSLSRDYFPLLNQFNKQTDIYERLSIQRQWLSSFLQVLNYQINPQIEELDKKQYIPLLGTVKKSKGRY